MDSSIVYFDDICVLCSRAVQLIIRNDPHGKFVFGASNSESIILAQNDKKYLRSSAVLRIAAQLRFPWPLLTVLFIIPRFIRDPFYQILARNRYRWFGRMDKCFVPSEEIKDRFLTDQGML